MNPFLQCGRYSFPLYGKNWRPLVMGILNVTPDSFSDGGQFHSLSQAIAHAEQMIKEGVDIIDIGGESTRPGAKPLPLHQELDRVIPVLQALRDCGKPLSVDTYKTEVMREAIKIGVDIINDVNAFQAEGALSVIKESQCGLCIMHMQHNPAVMQTNPQYFNVTNEVSVFLSSRVAAMENDGIESKRICVDPGFGFGKTLEHNLELLNNLDKIGTCLNLPILVGLSRKSMIGALTAKPVEHRKAGSLAAMLAAVSRGAKIVRVHDVADTVDALRVWEALAK